MAEPGAAPDWGRRGRNGGQRLAEPPGGPGRPDSHAGPEASFPREDPGASPRSGRGVLLAVIQDARPGLGGAGRLEAREGRGPRERVTLWRGAPVAVRAAGPLAHGDSAGARGAPCWVTALRSS